MSSWTIHAGHNPDGMTGCGAVGLIRESTEARNVVAQLGAYLKQEKVTYKDCTVNNGRNQNDVLTKLGAAMNASGMDYNVSIHFNSGAKDKTGNGKTTGVEVLLYNAGSELRPHAERVCANLAALGFKNRGLKYSKTLYVLRKSTKPTMLIEVCFVDDKDDTNLYNKLGPQVIAKAIAEAMLNKSVTTKKPSKPASSTTASTPASSSSKKYYRVQCGSYKTKGNATKMVNKLKAANFPACIKELDGLYKVQVGAYSKKANATAMVTKLKAANFDGFVVYS